MSEIERAKFEKAYREQFPGSVFGRDEYDNYDAPWQHSAWWAWQARARSDGGEAVRVGKITCDDVDFYYGEGRYVLKAEFKTWLDRGTKLYTHPAKPESVVPNGWREVVQHAVDELSIIDEFEGVAGFHLNGDVSPWDEGELPMVRDRLQALLNAPQHPAQGPESMAVQGITLDALSLREAAYWANPDKSQDEDKTEVRIEWMPDKTSTDGESMAAGYYLYYVDCPEEGVIGPLGDDPVPDAVLISPTSPTDAD